MFAYLIAGTKRAFGLYRPRRNLVILPDDIFLVSFPKSGNTWARFLIANLAYPEKHPDFSNIHQFVPDPFGTPKRHLDRMPRPRIIKSHECFEPRYPRVIYIVRDPRDVVVSQYHYHRKCLKIEDGYPMEKFVDRFLAGQTCPHGSWGEHVSTWLATRRNDPRFLMLRYEDMIQDTSAELARVASFLNIPATSELLAQAIEQSSAKRMRNLEKAQSHLNRLTKDGRKDLPFVRAASSGGWKSGLPENQVEKIEAAWGPLMTYLGYEPMTQPQSVAAAAEFMEPLLSSGTR
jgi:Sulfotransferase domain